MKNTLATVQSIAWQALRKASDPQVIRESIESRLFALSRSHDVRIGKVRGCSTWSTRPWNRYLGCESVTSAATVDQALAFMDARVFDAAMLDVNLSGHKSYPVADALAARGVPVGAGSGDGSFDHIFSIPQVR